MINYRDLFIGLSIIFNLYYGRFYLYTFQLLSSSLQFILIILKRIYINKNVIFYAKLLAKLVCYSKVNKYL